MTTGNISTFGLPEGPYLLLVSVLVEYIVEEGLTLESFHCLPFRFNHSGFSLLGVLDPDEPNKSPIIIHFMIQLNPLLSTGSACPFSHSTVSQS